MCRRFCAALAAWKTWLASYRTMTGGRSEPASIRWLNWATGGNTRFSTARISASRKIGKECSLSDILEENPHKRYFLSEKMTKRLLEKGADVTLKDQREGRTALHWAVAHWGEKKELVGSLLAKGADVNARTSVIVVPEGLDEGWTPLHVACESGNKKQVETLLASGAEVNVTTKNGWTPLSLAKEGEQKAIVELLRQHGAKESARHAEHP
jgi:hypothetical protein